MHCDDGRPTTEGRREHVRRETITHSSLIRQVPLTMADNGSVLTMSRGRSPSCSPSRNEEHRPDAVEDARGIADQPAAEERKAHRPRLKNSVLRGLAAKRRLTAQALAAVAEVGRLSCVCLVRLLQVPSVCLCLTDGDVRRRRACKRVRALLIASSQQI